MKKLIASVALVAVAAACSSSTHTVTTAVAPATSGNQTGGADPTSTLRGFLAAAKQQDLQGMGALFGDKDGTARDRVPRDELEKREIIMASCLKHDRYDIIGDAPGMNGARTMAVNLAKGDKSAAVNFEVVPASDRRWYVQSFDIQKLMADYCRKG
jgi:hypothetical protein